MSLFLQAVIFGRKNCMHFGKVLVYARQPETVTLCAAAILKLMNSRTRAGMACVSYSALPDSLIGDAPFDALVPLLRTCKILDLLCSFSYQPVSSNFKECFLLETQWSFLRSDARPKRAGNVRSRLSVENRYPVDFYTCRSRSNT